MTVYTLSNTLKACLRSSGVSFSASLFIISSTNSWKSTDPEPSRSESFKEKCWYQYLRIVFFTSINSSSSSSVGLFPKSNDYSELNLLILLPNDLITAPNSLVETVPSPSCRKTVYDDNYCHNPTNNQKQLKTTFVRVVLLSVWW